MCGHGFWHVAAFARMRAQGKSPHSGECGYGHVARISGHTPGGFLFDTMRPGLSARNGDSCSRVLSPNAAFDPEVITTVSGEEVVVVTLAEAPSFREAKKR